MRFGVKECVRGRRGYSFLLETVERAFSSAEFVAGFNIALPIVLGGKYENFYLNGSREVYRLENCAEIPKISRKEADLFDNSTAEAIAQFTFSKASNSREAYLLITRLISDKKTYRYNPFTNTDALDEIIQSLIIPKELSDITQSKSQHLRKNEQLNLPLTG